MINSGRVIAWLIADKVNLMLQFSGDILWHESIIIKDVVLCTGVGKLNGRFSSLEFNFDLPGARGEKLKISLDTALALNPHSYIYANLIRTKQSRAKEEKKIEKI